MTPNPSYPDTIVLFEHQASPVELGAEDVEYLGRGIGNRITLSRPFSGGGYLLNPNQFAGIVVLPSGRRIECRPKVPVRNFFVMLAVAFDLDPEFLSEHTTFQSIDDFFEFVIAYFAELVDRRISRGLYRAYVEREDNLPTVRGRIAIAEDARRNHVLRQRTYCRFAEFTWDIPENQIVRQVAHMVGGWVRSRALRRDLHQIDRLLSEVTPVALPASALDRFTYHRLNDDYRPIHRLCRLFLEGLTLSEDSGVFDFRTFLFDMNVLFEQFVTQLLRSRTPVSLDVEAQRSLSLDTAGKVTMRPDIVLRWGRSPVLAIDCKYKRLGLDEFKHHDQYQLLAYCTALPVNRGVLIYPRHEIDVCDEFRVRNSEVHIRQLTVDLGASRDDFDGACEDLVSAVVDWAVANDAPTFIGG